MTYDWRKHAECPGDYQGRCKTSRAEMIQRAENLEGTIATLVRDNQSLIGRNDQLKQDNERLKSACFEGSVQRALGMARIRELEAENQRFRDALERVAKTGAYNSGPALRMRAIAVDALSGASTAEPNHKPATNSADLDMRDKVGR